MEYWIFSITTFISFESIKAAEASINYDTANNQQIQAELLNGEDPRRKISTPNTNQTSTDIRIYNVYNYQFYVRGEGTCADSDASTPKPCFDEFEGSEKQLGILFEQVENNKKAIKSFTADAEPIKINCCLTCVKKIMHSSLSTEDSKTKERRKIICYLGFIMLLENPDFKPSKPLLYRDFSNADLIDFLKNLKLNEIDYGLVAARLVSYRFGVFHEPLLNYFFNPKMVYENLKMKYEESPSEAGKGSKRSQNRKSEIKLKKRYKFINSYEDLFESHLFDLASAYVNEYARIEIYCDYQNYKWTRERHTNFLKNGFSVFILYLVSNWNMKPCFYDLQEMPTDFRKYTNALHEMNHYSIYLKNIFDYEIYFEKKRCESSDNYYELDFDLMEIDCNEAKKDEWIAYRNNNKMPSKSAILNKYNYYVNNKDLNNFVSKINSQKKLASQNSNLISSSA